MNKKYYLPIFSLKSFILIYSSFFIAFVNSDSFEDALYNWTEHMDYQRFSDADKAFITLRNICSDSEEKKIIIECKIAEALNEIYRGNSALEDDKQAKYLLDLLTEIREENVSSAGTSEIFSTLIGSMGWVLNEADFIFIEQEIQFQIKNLSSQDNISNDLKDEYRVYFYDNLADLYDSTLLNDPIKQREYLDKALFIINKSNSDLEWADWSFDLKLRILDIHNFLREDAKALKLSLELFSESINLYKNDPNNYIQLFDQLMYFGALEQSNGNGNRSHLYYQLAYSLVEDLNTKDIGADLFWMVDRLSFQLLPGLDSCDDSKEFINFFKKVMTAQQNKQDAQEDVVQTEMSQNSILISELYCKNNADDQQEIAYQILANLRKQIDTNINLYYGDLKEGYYISEIYYKNKFSTLNDIGDFISKEDYLNILTLVQEFFYDHTQIDYFYEYDIDGLGYIGVIGKNLCDIKKNKAQKYIKEIENLFINLAVADRFYFTSEMLGEIYKDLVIIPSQCGLEKNVKGIYNIIKDIRVDENPSNIIGESSYSLASYRFLADAIFSKNEANIKSSEYNLVMLNREPSEIDLSMKKVSKANDDIKTYLEYQSNLTKFDEISLRTESSSLNQIDSNISNILDSFIVTEIDSEKIQTFVKENFYKDISIDYLINKLKKDESLLIYTFTWLNVEHGIDKEFLVQTCINEFGLFRSYKELTEKDSNLIFDISNVLFEDLVLNKKNSKKISSDYYKIFEEKFNCKPANYSKNSFVTNFNEVFNPNIFYKNEFLTKGIDLKVFHNAYRFIDEDISEETPRKYIGFGGVNYKESSFIDLPYSKSEVITSSKFFEDTEVYLSNDASKSNVSDSPNSFIHFAVHNDISIDNNDRIYSSLVLSGNNKNRHLYPDDIANHDFTNSFVVLSACNTFANSIVGRSTTSNLYNAFLISGASGVLSTSWDIESKSANEFVTKFFESASSNKKIYRSFKDAQKNLMNSNNYNHPYYWASFNLYH